jgi:xylan 1,4-beta-xylosidase
MTAKFSSDLSGHATALAHFWEHTVGSGHATLALRADWQAQLKVTHDELGMQHVRFHGILSDDMGTLVAEGDARFYSFFNADQIFDFLLSIGMKPFVELSFMPSILASGDQTIFSLSRERLAAKGLCAMGGADPKPSAPLGRSLRPG